MAFITHGAGKGIDAPDLKSTIHLLDDNGISVVGIEMPWLVAGKKVASPANQLDIAFEEIYKELSKNLDSRKNQTIKMIIKEPTLFTYLKNNIYNKEGK